MELTQKEINRALETPAQMTDQGSELERFNALSLARVMELEIAKASLKDLTHIRINMGISDACALAAFLRRGSDLGA